MFYTTEAASTLFGHSPWLVAVTAVFPAGIAALVFAFCVLGTRRDDLGAWPPVSAAVRVPNVPQVEAVTPADPAAPSHSPDRA